MKNRLLKYTGLALFGVTLMASALSTTEAVACDKFLCKTYQEKFEEALEKTSEGDPLLIMDFAAFNAWEDIVIETDSLRTTVLDDFDSYKKYRATYQAAEMPSNVKIMDLSPIDPGTSTNNKKEGINKPANEIQAAFNDLNLMQLDDSSLADLKLRGIMEDEYKLAATDTGSDAIVADSMEFSYSKVMDNYFRGIGKTDVRKITSHFINKFLKEPCGTTTERNNFDMRRLMLYREAIKEVAGLGYYAQVQSLDWDELLKDLTGDINKYTNKKDIDVNNPENPDVNKAVRSNYSLRQLLNRMLAVFAQVRSSQLELLSVKRMFRDNVVLYKKSMEYAIQQQEDYDASGIEE